MIGDYSQAEKTARENKLVDTLQPMLCQREKKEILGNCSWNMPQGKKLEYPFSEVFPKLTK